MEKGKGVMVRRWAIDFTDNSTIPSSRDIPDPLGYTRASQDQDDSTVSRQKKDAEANWKAQKAWEVAQAPFKNLLMMGFMMWMAGNTVHLFSIGITFSALWQPINALQGVGKVFEPYKDSKVDILGPKLLFIALNLAGMALGVWKLNTLGLLPTHASDWVSSLPPAQFAMKTLELNVFPTNNGCFYCPRFPLVWRRRHERVEFLENVKEVDFSQEMYFSPIRSFWDFWVRKLGRESIMENDILQGVTSLKLSDNTMDPTLGAGVKVKGKEKVIYEESDIPGPSKKPFDLEGDEDAV